MRATLIRLTFPAMAFAAAACSSDPIVVDLAPVLECQGPGPCEEGPFELPPTVWLEGRAWLRDGVALTGENARVRISPDSTFPSTVPSEVAPVHPESGRFARSMEVEVVCDLRLFARIEVLEASGDSVVARSEPTGLFEEGEPAGCPFPDAGLVDGVPRDTVVARDLFLEPS